MANEKRLIDANEFLNWLVKRFHCIPLAGSSDKNSESMKFLLSQAPTVDAVEVVHGRWIQSEPGYRLCSHCMADVAIYSGHRNYCPNCGAKMDGDGNE